MSARIQVLLIMLGTIVARGVERFNSLGPLGLEEAGGGLAFRVAPPVSFWQQE